MAFPFIVKIKDFVRLSSNREGTMEQKVVAKAGGIALTNIITGPVSMNITEGSQRPTAVPIISGNTDASLPNSDPAEALRMVIRLVGDLVSIRDGTVSAGLARKRFERWKIAAAKAVGSMLGAEEADQIRGFGDRYGMGDFDTLEEEMAEASNHMIALWESLDPTQKL